MLKNDIYLICIDKKGNAHFVKCSLCQKPQENISEDHFVIFTCGTFSYDVKKPKGFLRGPMKEPIEGCFGG